MKETSHPILLFGATTATGSAFLELAAGRPVVVAGRRHPPGWLEDRFLSIDLNGASLPSPEALPENALLVSFAPIWLLAPFLATLHNSLGGQGRRLPLAAVVACSSSSVITKRFAANREDRRLVERLLRAEESLEATCAKAAIPCRILRPTLIYGQARDRGDQNLSRLVQMMRRLPLLPLPAETGQRQPIHGRQLAAAALHLADGAARDPAETASLRIAIGGDETLSYTTLLQRLQQAARQRDPQDRAGHCRLLPLPPGIFHLLAAPLLPISAKGFEAVLRMEANLAGFTPVHSLLGTEPEPFPVAPLAWHPPTRSPGES
ncbi:MAG: hypothetical protein NTW51_10750 [Cyanobacteria bacterium]|nr:hypothetical protein [Cyanobacteriota bacterium]